MKSYLLEFLKFAGTSKITVFLDEAYNDAVKSDDPKKLAVRDFLVEVKQTVVREGINDYGWVFVSFS